MKKKGFTLIELLAVIVILAIIALIATPLVLKYIEKSRKESKVDSAYSFVRNLETEIANFSIKHNGKKYNGQPSDKGYYELDSFNGSEIDTTVKGDKPDTIKVCLSSLGQVEKAMFEYGKYYVSYDGKKGSISDEATYTNFSCSGNVAGGGTGNDGNSGGVGNDNIVETLSELTITFVEEDDVYRGFTDKGVDTLVSKITVPNNYYFTIIDPTTREIIDQTEIYANMVNGMLTMITPADGTWSVYMAGVMDNKLMIQTEKEIVGEYIVTFSSLNTEYIPYVMRVDDSDNYWISGTSFVIGEAKVTITDNYNNVYLNDVVLEFTDDGFGLAGFSSYGNNNVSLDIAGVYDAIAAGKKITTKIVQNIDGKEVITTIGASTPIYQEEYYSMRGSLYYWGNACFPSST